MCSQAIPTLTTERLVLRTPVGGDFPAYARLLATPRAKHMGGPYDQRTAWGMFCHEVACWVLFGHGALIVDLRTTGECVGLVGISHGPRYPEKELGWLVYEGHEGQGYATEAARALRDWAARSALTASSATWFQRTTAQLRSLSAWVRDSTQMRRNRILATSSTGIGPSTRHGNGAATAPVLGWSPSPPCGRHRMYTTRGGGRSRASTSAVGAQKSQRRTSCRYAYSVACQ
jgi:RimJ/RimL family protein N-acetyltransferase